VCPKAFRQPSWSKQTVSAQEPLAAPGTSPCHCFISVEQHNISLTMTTRLLLLVARASLYLLLPVFFILLLFAQSQTEVNHQDYIGKTELMHVAKAGDATRVEALITAGADVNLTSKTGRTPLIYAIPWRRTQVAEALIQAGADLNIAVQ
jgi:hypothetical protein